MTGFAILIAGLVLLAWFNRFIQDDAFIGFKYAANLVAGEGLVWNPGERVEGYTNFLWTMIMVLPIFAGADPVLFSQTLGLLAFATTLVLVASASSRVLATPLARSVAVLLAGTNYSFSCYATGGLETQLQALLVTAVVLRTMTLAEGVVPTHRFLTEQSLLWSFGLLTRLDTIVLIAPSIAWTLFAVFRATLGSSDRSQRSNWLPALVHLLAPPLFLLVPWFVWKFGYYGALLPNTFYAKSGNEGDLANGIAFLARFIGTYALAPILLLVLFGLARHWKRLDRPLGLLALTLMLWIGYVAVVGGGFMEFRFLVPCLPLFFVVIARTLVELLQHRILAVAACVWIIGGSFYHARTFSWSGDIEPIRFLASHIDGDGQDWRLVGKVLGEVFGPARDELTIATTAAGAIPFYSNLRTVDMLGLNDPWVAQHGIPYRPRTGHRKIAPIKYLVEREVNLLLGHPRVVKSGDILPKYHDIAHLKDAYLIHPDPQYLADASVVSIPIDDDWQLVVLYLVPSLAVDAIIAEQGLRRYAIDGL